MERGPPIRKISFFCLFSRKCSEELFFFALQKPDIFLFFSNESLTRGSPLKLFSLFGPSRIFFFELPNFFLNFTQSLNENESFKFVLCFLFDTHVFAQSQIGVDDMIII